MVNRYALTIGNREIVGSNVKFSLHHATVKMDWTIETDYAKAIAIIKPNFFINPNYLLMVYTRFTNTSGPSYS